MDSIAVLIPCYNEEQTVAKVVADAKRVLPEATVYVYNNNSTDRTRELAEQAGAVVRDERMQGKGNVIRRMFREVDAECYILVDGDDTYPMESAPEMADLVLHHGSDMVVGDRLSSTYFTENKRPFHNFGNTLVRGTINHLFKCDIKDIMTGFRAFSYDFVKTFPVLSQGFEIETEMTIYAVSNNLQIDNVVIDYRDRPAGSVSKLNTYSDGFKVIGTIFSLMKNYKPLMFFGFIALILAVIAVAFFIPVFSTYLDTGLVDKIPTLITCGFVGITAIISLFAGLVLSTQQKNDRRMFEGLRTIVHFQKKQLLAERASEQASAKAEQASAAAERNASAAAEQTSTIAAQDASGPSPHPRS
jgi:glycosyltransferase involved in cell wall biosynthesis